MLVKTKICIPIRESLNKKVVQLLSKYRKEADLVEVWIDQVRDFDVKALCNVSRSLVCVCKTAAEKGRFRGSDREKVDMLLECCKQNVAYVDVSLDTNPRMIRELIKNKRRTKVIISYHNFKKAPAVDDLKKIAKKMVAYSPDVVKIACNSRKYEDNFQLFEISRWLKNRKQKAIVIGMGNEGKVSRILAPLIGSAITFAAYSKGKESAPGQLTVSELRKEWRNLYTIKK